MKFCLLYLTHVSIRQILWQKAWEHLENLKIPGAQLHYLWSRQSPGRDRTESCLHVLSPKTQWLTKKKKKIKEPQQDEERAPLKSVKSALYFSFFLFPCFRLALNSHCILRSCLYSLNHQYWDYRCAPPCLINTVLEKEPRATSMLGKHSPNWAIPQPQHHLIHHVTFTTQSPPTNSSVFYTLRGTREVNTTCAFSLSWALLLNSLTVLFRAVQIVSSHKTRGALQSPADLLGRIFSADAGTSLTCSACYHVNHRTSNWA